VRGGGPPSHKICFFNPSSIFPPRAPLRYCSRHSAWPRIVARSHKNVGFESFGAEDFARQFSPTQRFLAFWNIAGFYQGLMLREPYYRRPIEQGPYFPVYSFHGKQVGFSSAIHRKFSTTGEMMRMRGSGFLPSWYRDHDKPRPRYIALHLPEKHPNLANAS